MIMTRTLTAVALTTAALSLGLTAGCHDQPDGQMNSGRMSDQAQMDDRGMGKAVAGNPGATTGPAAGYDTSDPQHYHPLSDDTRQAHPAAPSTFNK